MKMTQSSTHHCAGQPARWGTHMNMSRQLFNLAAAMSWLKPKEKTPRSAYVLDVWIAQATALRSQVGTGGAHGLTSVPTAKQHRVNQQGVDLMEAQQASPIGWQV